MLLLAAVTVNAALVIVTALLAPAAVKLGNEVVGVGEKVVYSLVPHADRYEYTDAIVSLPGGFDIAIPPTELAWLYDNQNLISSVAEYFINIKEDIGTCNATNEKMKKLVERLNIRLNDRTYDDLFTPESNFCSSLTDYYTKLKPYEQNPTDERMVHFKRIAADNYFQILRNTLIRTVYNPDNFKDEKGKKIEFIQIGDKKYKITENTEAIAPLPEGADLEDNNILFLYLFNMKLDAVSDIPGGKGYSVTFHS